MVLITNPIIAFTQDELLSIFDRILPPTYVEPLKDPGPGYEILQAYAKLFERVSKSVEILSNDSFILSANSGAKAIGSVKLYRDAAHPESITVIVKSGSIVTTSNGGKDFETIADITFGPTDLGPFDVGVQAIAVGYEYNVLGQATTADGTVIAGEIDTVKNLVEIPDLGDATIKVAQILPTLGGTDSALDSLGLDKGMGRLSGEEDSSYRTRIRTLPDTISKDAILRAVQAMLVPVSASYSYIETWQHEYQECWDSPATAITGSTFNPNLFVYDDPDADAYPFRNRWMDELDHRGCFIVIVSQIQPIMDVGLMYDDIMLLPSQFMSSLTGGSRAATAYDVPNDINYGYVRGGYDGFDPPRQAIYKGLYDLLQEIKPAGVSAIVELRGQ